MDIYWLAAIATIIALLLAIPPAVQAMTGKSVLDMWRDWSWFGRLKFPFGDKTTRYYTEFRPAEKSDGWEDEWEWIDPRGDCELLDLPGARLRISVPKPEHDLWPHANFDAPRLLFGRSLRGNFAVTARIRCQPAETVQAGGLLVWESEQNYWRLNRSRYMPDQTLGSQFVLLEGSSKGDYVILGRVACEANELYLRLRYSNGMLTAEYSTDGRHWRNVGRARFHPQADLHVGFVAINSWRNTPPFHVDLLEFMLEYA